MVLVDNMSLAQGRLLCSSIVFLSNNLYFTQVNILQALKPTSK